MVTASGHSGVSLDRTRLAFLWVRPTDAASLHTFGVARALLDRRAKLLLTSGRKLIER